MVECNNYMKSAQSRDMVQGDTRSKSSEERRSHARALRRALAQISPENSNPQDQSPLCALPGEIRNLIFEHAICQTANHSRPVESTSHTHRPGHEYHTCIDTSLLRTCRLFYYETRTLPLRSATHHLYEAPSESFDSRDWDHYLFHLSTQSGQNLHHLHVTKWRSPFTFDDYLKPHLHWRRLTWTLCASEWKSPGIREHFDVHDVLTMAPFPDTCQEVNLEFESLLKFPKQRQWLRECAQACRKAQLTRCNGTKLDFNENSSGEYIWEGTTWIPNHTHHLDGIYGKAKYHVLRLVWRGSVPEREYMHYDRLDCLQSNALLPFAPNDGSDNERGNQV